MPVLDPIRFTGTLSSDSADAPIGFVASIDDDGNLAVTLDPITPARVGTAFAPRDVPLQNMTSLRLEGRSEDGWRFTSDTFHISRWSHPEDRVEIEGNCGLAELSRDVAPDHFDMRAWFFRKLAAIHGITHQTALGRWFSEGTKRGLTKNLRPCS